MKKILKKTPRLILLSGCSMVISSCNSGEESTSAASKNANNISSKSSIKGSLCTERNNEISFLTNSQSYAGDRKNSDSLLLVNYTLDESSEIKHVLPDSQEDCGFSFNQLSIDKATDQLVGFTSINIIAGRKSDKKVGDWIKANYQNTSVLPWANLLSYTATTSPFKSKLSPSGNLQWQDEFNYATRDGTLNIVFNNELYVIDHIGLMQFKSGLYNDWAIVSSHNNCSQIITDGYPVLKCQPEGTTAPIYISSYPNTWFPFRGSGGTFIVSSNPNVITKNDVAWRYFKDGVNEALDQFNFKKDPELALFNTLQVLAAFVAVPETAKGGSLDLMRTRLDRAEVYDFVRTNPEGFQRQFNKDLLEIRDAADKENIPHEVQVLLQGKVEAVDMVITRLINNGALSMEQLDVLIRSNVDLFVDLKNKNLIDNTVVSKWMRGSYEQAMKSSKTFITKSPEYTRYLSLSDLAFEHGLVTDTVFDSMLDGYLSDYIKVINSMDDNTMKVSAKGKEQLQLIRDEVKNNLTKFSDEKRLDYLEDLSTPQYILMRTRNIASGEVYAELFQGIKFYFTDADVALNKNMIANYVFKLTQLTIDCDSASMVDKVDNFNSSHLHTQIKIDFSEYNKPVPNDILKLVNSATASFIDGQINMGTRLILEDPSVDTEPFQLNRLFDDQEIGGALTDGWGYEISNKGLSLKEGSIKQLNVTNDNFYEKDEITGRLRIRDHDITKINSFLLRYDLELTPGGKTNLINFYQDVKQFVEDTHSYQDYSDGIKQRVKSAYDKYVKGRTFEKKPN